MNATIDYRGTMSKGAELEREYTISIEIPNKLYDVLAEVFEKHLCKYMVKLTYKEPENYRVLLHPFSTVKQIKTVTSRRHFIMCYDNQFVFRVVYKRAIEEFAEGEQYSGLEGEGTLLAKQPSSTIRRSYVYEQNNQLRIAIEKLNREKYTQGDLDDGNVQIQGNKLFVDNWVRLTSTTFLVVEYELGPDEKEDDQIFQKALQRSDLFATILGVLRNSCMNLPFHNLLETSTDLHSRIFTPVLSGNVRYTAPKLDGVRKNCIIHQNEIKIEGASSIRTEYTFPQAIKCHVEKMSNMFVLIDMLEIWGPEKVYVKLDHLDAIALMNSDYIQRLRVPNLFEVNVFVPPGASMQLPFEAKQDGQLVFTDTSIVKNKEHTVDLILRRFLHKSDRSGTLSSRRGADAHAADPIEDQLVFADQTPFSKAFPGWLVVDMPKIAEAFPPATSATRNFRLLEFRVDDREKKIYFLNFRDDKMQANMVSTMKNMKN